MKGMSDETSRMFWTITFLLICVFLFIYFSFKIITLTSSECWREQVKAVDDILQPTKIEGRPLETAGLILKACTLKIVIGTNGDGKEAPTLCERTCTEVEGFSEGDEEGPGFNACIEACKKCGDRGVIIAVPKILDWSGVAGGALGGEAIDSLKRAWADTVVCRSTGKLFADTVDIDPAKGTIACLKFPEKPDKKIGIEGPVYKYRAPDTNDPAKIAEVFCK